MFSLLRFIMVLLVMTGLSSCEIKCNVGNQSTNRRDVGFTAPVVQDGAILYNGIKLETKNIKLTKAYLVYADGTRVEENNFVDFKSPVKLILIIDSGWVEKEGKVFLGVYHSVKDEENRILLDDRDLFKNLVEGVGPNDAKIIGITSTIKLIKNAPPQSFTISFRVWDKTGDGYIKGNFRLHSK